MDEKKLKTISSTATLALVLLLILSFGILWGAFKDATGLTSAEKEENVITGNVKPVYKAGDTKAGKDLFFANCARCHMLDKKLTGPALMNVKDRWADSTALYAWVKNSQNFLSTGDKYANNLFREYNSIMPAFPQLTDADIKEVLYYVDPE